MRGVSGAGKDWWIKSNLPNAKIISTDDYHMVNGKFVFQKEKLGEFHNLSLLAFISECQKKTPLVVVNNTNVRMFELAPFFQS